MIPQHVLNYDYKELVNWLRNEAGSSNPDYFKAIKKNDGSLKLQQVPEEYANLLLMLKNHKPKSYLELGVGNGGSFAMACFIMQETLTHAVAVDCLAYKNLGIGQCEEEINSFISFAQSVIPVDKKEISGGRFIEGRTVFFINKTTDNYFSTSPDSEQYDVIFIDADHSYEGVRKDFVNTQKHINEGGLIIFHDIASKACPGIMKIWSEIKAQDPERCIEFIHSETCGIGVLKY